jgi:hypothetical protein
MMAYLEVPIKVSVTIVVMSFDELGFVMTSEPISKDDMLCIVQQLMAEKKGWA